MGRPLPSITMAFLQEKESFTRSRRALRRSDQLVLDDLFAPARQHLSAAAYAAHSLPFESFLLAMLIEEHKHVLQLRSMVDDLLADRERRLPEGLDAAGARPEGTDANGTGTDVIDTKVSGTSGHGTNG